MLRYAVSQAEADLISEIEEIGYGEILSVSALKGLTELDFSGTPRQLNFLKALRLAGRLDRVVIHDGEPTAAEVSGLTRGGLQCIRKLKF